MSTKAVIGRLTKAISNQKYYEAAQIYKTTNRRLVMKKKYPESINFLSSGIKCMLKHEQQNSAGELGLLLIKTYELANLSLDDTIDGLIDLLEKFPQGSQAPKVDLIKSCLEWSKNDKRYEVDGHPDLNFLLGRAHYESKQYGKAQPYFIVSDKQDLHVKMLVEWSSKGYKSERDLFIAKTTLKFILNQNLKDANYIFKEYTRLVFPKKKSWSPLLNFISFTLLTLERDAYPVYSFLVKTYTPSLERDNEILENTTKISEIYYGVKKQKEGGLDMFQSLFSNFFQPQNNSQSSVVIDNNNNNENNSPAPQSLDVD